MLINVSQLLRAPVGTTRDYDVNEAIAISGDSNNYLFNGKIRLTHTPRSILVTGKLNTEVKLTCSRCLSLYRTPLLINIEEEYFPTIDVVSGVPLPQPEESDAFTIDTQHVLDLTEAIRQYSLLAIPMKPICHEGCAGLCPNCGHNLNKGPCNCPAQELDPRWSTLKKLL